MNAGKQNFISSSKTNNLLLNEDIENEICKKSENRIINVNNAATLFSFSRFFNLSNLSKLSFCFINRCFPMVVNCHNFLELDFISVAKIISSNDLSIDSELQVFNAADFWLSHKITERNKYSKDLLLRVRLSLLSVSALKHLLVKKSCFINSDMCTDVIKELLETKKHSYTTNFTTNSRYCNQNKFCIIMCGGKDMYTQHAVSDVGSIKASNFDNIKTTFQMNEGRQCSKIVYVERELYVFGGFDSKNSVINSVERYSFCTNSWETIDEMYDDRTYFSACTFMSKIYLIGGVIHRATNSCIEINIKDRTYSEVARMNEERLNAACAVFQGKIVVSGGFNLFKKLNTVEAYDHVVDEWSYMPDMIEERFQHSSVAIKNKLFVLGGFKITFEVFDSITNKFVLLKPPSKLLIYFLNNLAEVISIGSKLVVFHDEKNSILLYDVTNDEWSEKSCEITNNISRYCCVKAPQM